MVQPKYSPEEALQRIKLMMEYDSSKTLDENKKVISEQDTLSKTGIATAATAGTAAAIAGGAAAANVATTTALGAGTYTAMGVGATLAPSLGVTAAAALGAGVIGGAAALALTPLVVWYMDKDNAKSKVDRIVQYCTTDKSKIDKLERGISDGDVRNLSDQLYDAMKGVGTDEEAVYGAFKSLKTASDFCALVARFNKDYGSEGDLMEFLDDDFDQTSEWMQIFRPLRDIVEDSLLSIKDEGGNSGGGGSSKTGGGGSKTGGYKSCSGTYSKGCKSNAIAKVQGCLGLVTDGKFGPKTQSALSGKGFTTFTDADVNKICEKTTPVVEPEISGEEQGISGNNTDF
jgi:uncharacterized membrane protein YgcG